MKRRFRAVKPLWILTVSTVKRVMATLGVMGTQSGIAAMIAPVEEVGAWPPVYG
jgi:Na+-transporting NADH:ubiquinone oxidoreductase subunit NqrC